MLSKQIQSENSSNLILSRLKKEVLVDIQNLNLLMNTKEQDRTKESVNEINAKTILVN